MAATAERFLSAAEIKQRCEALPGVLRMQQIEDNPLTAEEIALLEMFDREAWTTERCIDAVHKRLSRDGVHRA